jgi:alkanesulfonate monooxygenase SsuD/methylene tetrahydromethanopterin reductase-like flavin-dependent oxidoreductase (luciferase family)
MDIDIILDARADADELAQLGTLAEQFGIRGVWVSSLLDSRDPFTNMAVLARATQRLQLGPVAVNPFDMHPVRIAAGLLTLNELAGGRARIVIGGGGEALAALGIEPVKRVRAVAECVDIIRAAASGETVNYRGEIFQVSDLKMNWLSSPPPPICVGASMEQMLRMSARVADGIMMSDMPVTLTGQVLQTLDDSLPKFGKQRPGFSTNAFSAWHVYPDYADALHEARQWLVLRGIFRPWVLREFLSESDVSLVMSHTDSFWRAFKTQSPVVEGVPDAVLDAMVENLTFTASEGDLDSKIDKLRRYADAGLSAISLRLYRDPAKSIRMLGERVLPALNQ